MIVYGVSEVEGTPTGTLYFRSEGEARRFARTVADERGIAQVTRDVVASLPAARRVLALLNYEGWCAESTIVAEFKRPPSDSTEGG